MNVVEQIEEIVAREMRSDAPHVDARIDDAVDKLMSAAIGPGIGDILERRYRDYVVLSGLGSKLPRLADDLRQMRSWEIAASPEPLALLPTTEGYVLVGRYWACPDEHLLEIDKTMLLRPGPAARFRRDMHVLAEHGKLHPYAGRGYYNWLVGERSGTIVLSAWGALRPLLDSERDDLLASLDRLLERRTEVP